MVLHSVVHEPCCSFSHLRRGGQSLLLLDCTSQNITNISGFSPEQMHVNQSFICRETIQKDVVWSIMRLSVCSRVKNQQWDRQKRKYWFSKLHQFFTEKTTFSPNKKWWQNYREGHNKWLQITFFFFNLFCRLKNAPVQRCSTLLLILFFLPWLTN